jgi:hypothetical protein
MQTILAATLVVRVMGLATFTDQVPNDCGVHVIVPRVESHQHGKQKAGAPHVEEHKAMLVVPEQYYDTSSTWKMAPIPAFKSYRYVELDGDQVRLLTNGTNQAASLEGLKLPSLQGCCAAAGKKKTLHSNFQAPYTGAAAVMDLSAGRISACAAAAKGDAGYRYDTEIFFQHEGMATISGDTMKTKKEIRLKNLSGGKPAVVYLVNFPTCFLTNDCKPKPASAPDGLSHVQAYYAMLQGDTSKCQASLRNCPAAEPGRCVTPPIAATVPQAMSFECSNTKYP